MGLEDSPVSASKIAELQACYSVPGPDLERLESLHGASHVACA